jgi:uncharacterized protein YjbJ (UPF0337 family)
MAINAQELQGQWDTLRGQVKDRWGQLTDDDLQIQEGNVDQLVGRIQQRTGEGRETIEQFLGELAARGSSIISRAAETIDRFAHQASNRLRENTGRMADEVRVQFNGGQVVVRRNMTRSVAVPFGFGLIAGLSPLSPGLTAPMQTLHERSA